MRNVPVIITMLLLPFFSVAQTDISGVINSYHKVTQVISANASLKLDNTSGLNPGDLVMIIQMKGATVDVSNNSAFGSVTGMNNAGNYEINTVCTVDADQVYLYRQLAQTYTSADKVQLVRIPQYASARVIDTLKALPWDSATGKGGVLALHVVNNIILDAPVYATGKGYHGGAYMTSDATCFNVFAANSWFYNATNSPTQNGAYKGEGVADLALNYSGGKGAPANGGGGGNNHNNGGGGGANLFAGGDGGGNSSAAGCTVSNPGKGGYALSNNSGSKIFMGGGGGAGHANSGFFSSGGGYGGGVVFIHAGNLISNGYKIISNGTDGGSTTGDGASGAGAGGTIILDIPNYADAINAEAKGGNGGDENDDATSQRCYGEGGGGSGGVIYFKSTVPAGTKDVSGGSKGNRINSLNCAAVVFGTNGTTGTTVPNYSFIQSSVLSTFCGIALDVQLTRFNVKTNGNNAIIEWQADQANELKEFVLERKKDGGTWNKIYSVTPSAFNNLYTYNDQHLEKAIYYYRLKMPELSGKEKYSVVKSIQIGQSTLAIYPNPASGVITVTYPFAAGMTLKLVNTSGQIILQNQFHRNESFIQLNLSSFRKGVYYLLIDGRSISFSVQ